MSWLLKRKNSGQTSSQRLNGDPCTASMLKNSGIRSQPTVTDKLIYTIGSELKKLLLVSCLLCVQPLVSASTNVEFSRALGWEQKWLKVTARSTETYLSRIENGPFAALSATNRKAAVSELRQSLHEQLSWEVVGQELTQGIIRHCDSGTLETMTRFYNNEPVSGADRESVAKRYASCAGKGFSESIGMLRKVIIESRANVEAIIKKYQ